MTLQVLIAAILWLSPMPVVQAESYASHIQRESLRWDLDPLLVLAVIHRESRFTTTAKSKTNDYGLMQVHVSKTTYSGYLRYPERLYNYKLNIRLGVRLMAMWRDYHAGRCEGNHPHWSHYKYGKRIPKQRKGKKVDAIYHQLQVKFRERGSI